MGILGYLPIIGIPEEGPVVVLSSHDHVVIICWTRIRQPQEAMHAETADTLIRPPTRFTDGCLATFPCLHGNPRDQILLGPQLTTDQETWEKPAMGGKLSRSSIG